ncbi:MAG TPA: 30S ribosomal protein S12 methylthiotransferase RimO, partial [Oscillospiraceae bacterium]|nr:30S ribosomal protein S12 methylthiotransferase RimO [Oscillospiraceae bacterium]
MPEETSAVKVGFVALGCSKNQVDAELMMGALKQAGFEISSDPDACEVVVINTCAFIESAKAESIQSVLEFCRKKESGNPKVVVVTGCLAERYREQVVEQIPEADVVLG